MRDEGLNRPKPDIVVSEDDYDRLNGLARAALGRTPEIARELLAELDRARVVDTAMMPPDVVRMGSLVHFGLDDSEPRWARLVFPIQADIAAGRISILTPVGTALLGLAAGQSIMWAARDGRPQQLSVLAVEKAEALTA